MAFLRLLTNPRVMGADVLGATAAISVYREPLSDERVEFEPEPPNLESLWMPLIGERSSGSGWTDAYLAAFALEGKLRLISFDAGMRGWRELELELLRPPE